MNLRQVINRRKGIKIQIQKGNLWFIIFLFLDLNLKLISKKTNNKKAAQCRFNMSIVEILKRS
jgi:hypothetical protein